jgi:NAD(P)-dependent dehydrogenase (short-subunit alcohol dehydrogenase family)
VKELAGKVAVVTGGASGIGRALAEGFCREGMHVVIGDVEEPALTQAVGSLAREGASVIGVRADVSRAADVEALRDQALSAFGAVHVVCNNAGIGTAGPVDGTPLERWRWTLDVNLWGVIHGCRAFLPLLLQQREGRIVNTASIAALAGHPMLGAYTASARIQVIQCRPGQAAQTLPGLPRRPHGSLLKAARTSPGPGPHRVAAVPARPRHR